jgi:hypothetical protein
LAHARATNYVGGSDDLRDWIDEQIGEDRDEDEIITEGQLFYDKEGGVHSSPWSKKQKEVIKKEFENPKKIKTKKGVTIQFIKKTKQVVVRKKDGTFKSKKGYGKQIQQVLQKQIEAKARTERLSGKERRKLKKLHRKQRNK